MFQSMNDQSGLKIIFVHDSRDILVSFIFVSKKLFVSSFRLRSVMSAAHHGVLKHVFFWTLRFLVTSLKEGHSGLWVIVHAVAWSNEGSNLESPYYSKLSKKEDHWLWEIKHTEIKYWFTITWISLELSYFTYEK